MVGDAGTKDLRDVYIFGGLIVVYWGMSFCFGRIAFSPSLPALIMEGLTLLGLGLAFITEYWMGPSSASNLAPGIIGALFLFFAVCAGIVAAVILLVNIFRNRIDMGTIVAFVPFLGFAIWGVWYACADPSWVPNLMICWGLLGVIVALWIYAIVKYVKRRTI